MDLLSGGRAFSGKAFFLRRCQILSGKEAPA